MKFFEPFPPAALVPNAITAAGIGLGLLAMVAAATGAYGDAAWLITLAALTDKLDGFTARRLGVSSAFGVQMDSLSDLLTFGVAPAALVYFAAQSLAAPTWGPGASVAGAPATLLLGGIAFLYVVATAVRLARFNVVSEDTPGLFLGLPSTLSGALLGSGFLAVYELGWQFDARLFALLPPILLLNAVLMVSNLGLPKLGLPSHKAMRAFQLFNVVAIYVVVPLRLDFVYPFLLALSYAVIGFVVGTRRLLAYPSAAEPRAAGDAPA